MTVSTAGIQDFTGHASGGFVDNLNTRWHRLALLSLLAIVLVHWAEHIVQAYQFFVLHWPRPMSMGLVGTDWELGFNQSRFHHAMQVLQVCDVCTFSTPPALPPCSGPFCLFRLR